MISNPAIIKMKGKIIISKIIFAIRGRISNFILNIFNETLKNYYLISLIFTKLVHLIRLRIKMSFKGAGGRSGTLIFLGI